MSSSYYQAKEDGIKTGEYKEYYIPCEICGTLIRRTAYSRKRTYICEDCKKAVRAVKDEMQKPDEGISLSTKTSEKVETPEEKHEKRFSKAVEKIRDQVDDFPEYEKAIEIAKTRIMDYDSIPEAMASIELIKNGFKIIPQQHVGKRRVDFCIPSYKVMLEVDGELYHNSLEKEGKRDFYLFKRLGPTWIIIHYPAEIIFKDIKRLTRDINKRILHEEINDGPFYYTS